jgi:hypothetical protein
MVVLAPTTPDQFDWVAHHIDVIVIAIGAMALPAVVAFLLPTRWLDRLWYGRDAPTRTKE